jgi:hypothetical protein
MLLLTSLATFKNTQESVLMTKKNNLSKLLSSMALFGLGHPLFFWNVVE